MKRGHAFRAWALAALLVAAAPAIRAHEGHDHGPEPVVAGTDAPRRLPDGSVLLPKASQRQIGLRTVVTRRQALPRTVELPGRVVTDPNAGGAVQPTIAGRVEPPPRGLPGIGQPVRRGEVLAIVRPSIAPVERAGQQAQLADLRAQRALVAKRVARLRDLSDTVPRREIEAAESELAGLDGRIAALAGGLGAEERLVAPISGVVAEAGVMAGQVVDARETLFRVVDPSRLLVEASAFDPALARDVAGASLSVGGMSVPLRFVGASRVLREQALPLVFRGQGDALASLAIGQPVTVAVATRATVDGIPLPASTVARNASNETVVWVKTAPERFAPRIVRTLPLDGARVSVVDGLRPGERVVTAGAALLGQVR